MTWGVRRVPTRDQLGGYEGEISAEGIEIGLEKQPLFCRPTLRRYS